MDTRTRAHPRLARKLSWLVVASLAGAALFAPSVRAASVEPVFLAGGSNTGKDCVDVDQDYGQTWLQAKQDPNGNGEITVDGFGTITVSNTQGDKTFDWSSTFGIDAVIAKGGSDGSNLYVYAPTAGSAESFGDTNLTTPGTNAISHISFCFDTSNPPPTDPPPTDTPPTDTPPTDTPPTDAPPTDTPPTDAPPTDTPPTEPPDGGVLPTATPAGGVAGSTGTPNVTLPPTDTLGTATSAPAGDGWRLILLAMAGIVAGALLLTPASTVVNRKDDRQA